jgi:ubiquinone/menaquinone biosynthesis C-methylase UbiE
MRRYDATAQIYDTRYREEQAAKIKAALRHVQLDAGAVVLDVGCGTGLLFGHVADAAERVVGLDFSRKSLLAARDRSKTFSSVGLVLADADSMPFKDHVFSHVFAFTLIQNMPCPAETLQELERAARSKAVFVVTGLKRIFARKAFEALLESAGLHVVAFEDGDDLKCFVAVCAAIRH